MEEAGVRLVAIGNGTPGMARDFAQEFEIRYPLYTDPARDSFRWFGMKRKFGLGIGALKRAWRAYKAGFRQGAVKGDAWQQGGAVLVDQSGALRWSHVDDGPGDHADLDAVLQAAKALS